MNSTTTPGCAASVVISTHNRRDDLRECLASLPWERLTDLGVEVVVVEDGCTDGTSAMIPAEFSEARLVTVAPKQGPSYCRNRGAGEARGELLLFIDDDAVVEPGWLDAMLAADDGRTLLGGRILDLDGQREQGGPARSTFIGKRLPCAPERATVGATANLGVPRAAFKAIDGFDLDLPYYFEDSDLCIRARKAGYGFRYVAGAAVRHKGSEVKQGEAIRMQEHNSTYAMLKAYRGNWGRLLAFSLLNGAWMIARLVAWGLRGRIQDCRRLVAGWWTAHTRFARGRAA